MSTEFYVALKLRRVVYQDQLKRHMTVSGECQLSPTNHISIHKDAKEY